MAEKKMGFEGVAYSGVAGSTATNQLTNSRDLTETIDHERGETTVRGTSAAPPQKTERVCAIVNSMEITMLNDSADTNLEAMRQASKTGGPLAIRMKDYAAGKGFDGDCTLTMSRPFPLKGEQVVTFTCTPTNESGREPQSYV